jgi:WD40 repeat protein
LIKDSKRIAYRKIDKRSLINNISWSQDNSLIAVGLYNGSLKIIKVKNLKVLKVYKLDEEINWIEWSHSADKLIIGTKRGIIIIKLDQKDIKKMEMGLTITGKINSTNSIIAVSTEDSRVLLLDLESYEKIGGIKFKYRISKLAWSPCNRYLACGMENGIVRVRDLSIKKSLGSFGYKNETDWEYQPIEFLKDTGAYFDGSQDINEIIPKVAWVYSHYQTTNVIIFLDTKYLAISYWRTGSIGIWNLESRKCETHLYFDFLPHSIQWVPQSKILVIADGFHRKTICFEVLIPSDIGIVVHPE